MSIQISIIRDSQITTQGLFPTMEEAQAWLAHHEGMKSFGQPKQIVQQQVEISPAVLDEEGNELSPAVTEMQEIELAGDYEVEILDVTSQLEQEQINAEAQAFLDSTDWMVIRAAERGEELSPEFKAERQAASQRIVR
jgi:hypothetical protein